MLNSSQIKNKVKNKIILITGASSGIGSSLAVECSKNGAHLILLARRKEKLQEVASLCTKNGVEVLPLICDINDEKQLETSIQNGLNKFGRIDIVVANAGFGVADHLENLTVHDYRRQFETNVFSLIQTSKLTLDALKNSKGILVLIGSVAGYVALPGSSPYSMSKFAVRGFADAIRYELSPQGVSVVLISPGFVDSEIRKVDNTGTLHSEVKDPIPSWVRMPTDVAAKKILKAIIKRKKEEVITFHGKVIVQIQRHFPVFFDLLKKHGGLKSRSEPKN